jgi:LysM repeat protein
MKVSKVILIVVALHVLVIGGIFIFEGCSRAKPGPQLAENESVPGATNLVANNTGTLTTPEAGLTPAAPLAPVAPVAPVAPAIPAKTYVVKKGDSLWKIAKAEKVSVADLARANNLSQSSVLQLNQKLIVPAKTEIAAVPAAPATPTAPAMAGAPAMAANTYEVQIGDSLWKIAKNQGTTIAALKQANNLKSDALKVGQKLTIPARTATTTATVAPVPARTPAAAPAGTLPAGTTISAPGGPVTPPAGTTPAVVAPGFVLN